MAKPFEIKTGTYTGTGSAVTEATIGSCGFKPLYLKIWNDTDGDASWEYVNGMTAAYAYQVSDSGSGTTDLSKLTSNGITLSDTGFAVGTSLSESGKTFRYIAINGPYVA